MFAVIRVRGLINSRKDAKLSLKMLNLERTNHCVIVPQNNEYIGMLKASSDYVTWGEITNSQLERLLIKRGFTTRKQKLSDQDAKKIVKVIMDKKTIKGSGVKPVFRLSPPRKGYKSTKLYFPRGDLGYRGDYINNLLSRMV